MLASIFLGCVVITHWGIDRIAAAAAAAASYLPTLRHLRLRQVARRVAAAARLRRPPRRNHH